MSEKRVTSLEEIRAQAEPELVDIPGFRPGTTITVALRPVDLTPHLLAAGVRNPLLGAAMKRAQEGKTKEQIEAEIEADVQKQAEIGFGSSLEAYLPAIDAVVKEALVEPTWEQITAIRPLSLTQKIEIFNKATGDVKILQSFRGKRRA